MPFPPWEIDGAIVTKEGFLANPERESLDLKTEALASRSALVKLSIHINCHCLACAPTQDARVEEVVVKHWPRCRYTANVHSVETRFEASSLHLSRCSVPRRSTPPCAPRRRSAPSPSPPDSYGAYQGSAAACPPCPSIRRPTWLKRRGNHNQRASPTPPVPPVPHPKLLGKNGKNGTCLGPLRFLQGLVGLEEVRDLPQGVLREVSHGLHLLEAGILFRHGKDLQNASLMSEAGKWPLTCLQRRRLPYLLIHALLILHDHVADGAAVHDAARHERSVAHDQDVERVSVATEGLRDEAIVVRVEDRGMQHAVQHQQLALVVVLVLHPRLLADFHEDGDRLRGIRAPGDVVHSLFFTSPSALYQQTDQEAPGFPKPTTYHRHALGGVRLPSNSNCSKARGDVSVLCKRQLLHEARKTSPARPVPARRPAPAPKTRFHPRLCCIGLRGAAVERRKQGPERAGAHAGLARRRTAVRIIKPKLLLQV
eukprot:scaffold7067_cov245-Pinguiococcus_pyrenoidosus.AAC.16